MFYIPRSKTKVKNGKPSFYPADDIKKLRTQKPELRSAQREAALRETKERNKAKKAEKIKNKAVAKANQPKVKAPKGGNKNARGGAKR